MRHGNLDIIGYGEIEKGLDLAPVLQIVQKITENYCPCLYLPIGQVW